MTLKTLNKWEEMNGFSKTELWELPEDYEEEDLLQIYEEELDSLDMPVYDNININD